MRVKRLEIQGFKSFKDKTVIHFDEGITGIVGPNGCGKSNIVDAFFWVMGEQSYKHMRGTGSEDLIFNGSSKYSPLGLAEATLVMETDAQDLGGPDEAQSISGKDAPAGATVRDIPLHLRAKEISVTRRVYRTGEGEYFINGTLARLKDIQELFMDTGVGAKGYSVIEQGQIGKIVNAKPEDRRLLVEEAAGIAKYKARKKESLRKMEATQTNLSRLNDVIQEIERNLGSLERQAQRARQYKKYKEEMLDKEMTWGRRKNQVLNHKLECLKKDREAMEQELLGLRAELQVAENGIEGDRTTQLTDTKLAEDLQATLQESSRELAREQSALDLSRRRQGDLATQLQTLQAEQAQLQQSIADEIQRIAAREHESASASESHLSQAAQAEAMEAQVRTTRLETDVARKALDGAKKDLMSGVTEASDLTSREAALASRMDSALMHAERLRQQVQIQEAKVAEATEEAARAKTAAEEIGTQREGMRAQRKSESARIQTLDQELRQAEREREEASRALTQTRSRLQSLEELAAANEGLGEGPKAALEWARAKGKAGQLSPLADAIEVQPGFEAALDGWLGARLESLVAEDASLALDAVNSLREGGQGKVAIQLLSSSPPAASELPSEKNVASALAEAGFEVLGVLSEFVKANSKKGEQGKSLAQQLARGVLVVKSFAPMAGFLGSDGLQKLSGWSIVSQEGSALDGAGTLRGGAESTGADSVGHLLGRKKAIHALEADVQSAEGKFAQLEAVASERKQAVEQARERFQALESELQALEIMAAGLERDVHQTARALKESNAQLQLVNVEQDDIAREIEETRKRREEIETSISRIVSMRSELEERIFIGQSSLETKEEEMRELEAEFQAIRVGEASLRERSLSLARELESGRSILGDRERRLAEIERILNRASREQEEHSGGDQGLEQRIVELTLLVATTQDQLSAVKNRLEEASAKLNATLERIKELHHRGDQKNADSMQLALDIEKSSGELAHLVQNLEEKYGPGCLERPVTSPIQEEMKDPVVTAEMTAEEELLLGEEVERLRERIRRLGEVNVMAIEEYEELKKRFDYLLTEKSDLEHSIQNLQDAIEYINKTSEDRFSKAFEAIADRFERLFPIIFGGGQAKLSLVYPEGSTDILDAGVDILAQPPGKKIVNIALLSGGEKALTAVSLIFAIFMVKPSPFCVLDEVDAPLDDANIGKFNALLKEMSAKSQFILITHNKKTMELNDTLYGVTMEEPGVSKMVSVQLN